MRALKWTSIVGLLSLFLVSSAPAQVTRIKVGYSSIGVGQSLVWVAKDAGLFKENGLDVQLIFIGSSSILTQAVIAGDVPIAIMSDPGGPVYLCFDVTDQEAAIEKEIPLPDPKRFRPAAPLQADYDAIKEAAQLLASAQNPVILADYVGRNNDAVMSLVALADLLSIPVIDLGARLNFPNTHSLNLTGKNRELIASADVIMGLDVTDLYGALVRTDPNTHANVPATKPGCKVINVTLKDIVVRGWTSDFQELAPVDLPIVANTRVFLPALAEEIRKQGKFSKTVVDDRRKALATQHEEVHDETI